MLPFPEVWPQRFEWGQQASTLRVVSVWNGSEQVIEHPGTRWTALIGWDAMNPHNTRIMRAFVAQLRGGAEFALIGPMMQRAPAGTLRGAPVVNGANQTGRVIGLRDCQPGRTLLAGDYIQIGDQVHMVCMDAMANTDGLMAITVEPPRRKAPADGELVRWHRPAVGMRLVGDGRWAQKFGALPPGWSAGLELQFAESWV